MALNPLLLLRKSVPKILKCRNFRGNQSEREEAGLACDADQNESTLMPKMMGFELRHFFELYSMMFVKVARLPAMRLSSANWKRSSSDVTSSAPRFN